jgi:tRNA (guanine37-N1)-methyltransferase
MSLVYSALVHHPVRDREGLTATASVTNIDVHDIARSSHTFGLAGMFVVTPIDAQRALVTSILEHWRVGAGKRRMPHRSEALAICQSAASIAEARELISARHGQAPRVIATAARASEGTPVLSFSAVRAQLEAAGEAPWLLLFGTGHGLTDDVLNAADLLIEPIHGHGDYNHLSVRAAAAIVFDRLFGQR